MRYHLKLTYFKPTGKYYGSGESFISTENDFDKEECALYEIWDLVQQHIENGRLPGLVDGSNQWLVLVEVPNHPHNHPRMMYPLAWRNTLASLWG